MKIPQQVSKHSIKISIQLQQLKQKLYQVQLQKEICLKSFCRETDQITKEPSTKIHQPSKRKFNLGINYSIHQNCAPTSHSILQ